MLEKLKTWWRSVTDEEWRLVGLIRSARALLRTDGALVLALLDWLPAIIERMRAAEREFPLPGSGPLKLAALLGWLESQHGSALRQIAAWGVTVDAVRALVAVLVAVLNTTGMLTRSGGVSHGS